MKLLANENFPLASVKFLKTCGFDIDYIADGCSGISDMEVMEKAIKENRTILTFDRDYGELIFKYNLKPMMGVIYLRLDRFESDEPGKIVGNLFKEPEFDPSMKLTVVSENSIRQRLY
jgi:predicted nuclease of predicted toxin-antitoxin system